MIEDSWDKKNGSSILIEGDFLVNFKSEYQLIEVFQTKRFGKLLRLDGVIQLTEFDEAKVEIDKAVINISKKFFPNVSESLDDPRVSIINEEGANYVRFCNTFYDIIIIDSTDPFSIGQSLFKESFYSYLKKILKFGGIIVSQSESMFYDRDLIKEMHKFKKKYFKYVKYYYTMVPTYPSGTIGFQFCSEMDYSQRKNNLDKIDGLKYYNSSIHSSSFVTPNFISNL